MTNLAGLHDIESTAIAPPGTWVLDTIALSENPQPKSYPASLNVIVRANWGYGSTGTLPTSDRYGEYLVPLAGYVRNSQNCHRWIIGNEPNLSREWPDDQPIYPHHYAKCYGAARSYIHAIPSHEHDEVLIAAPGPWNAELKYQSNPNGDWIRYFADVIKACGDGVDGFALHAYTHGYHPALVTSTARMNAPFQDRYYEFRTYRDYLGAIPPNLWHLPAYITEANGNGPWQAVGLMPAMLDEINDWNSAHPGVPRQTKISAVIFYRYPHYDDFYIEGRNDVIAEYQAAVGKGYTSPTMGATTMPETTFIPAVSTGTQQPALPPREIDPQAALRGVRIETPDVAPGQQFWFAKNINWLNEQESQGRHHIFGNVYKGGEKVAGVPLVVNWPSGAAQIKTEDKSKDPPPWDYWYNYPMSPSLNEFSIKVNDGAPTETVKGIGMGADGNSHVHTSTVVEWELVTMAGTQPDVPAKTTPLFVIVANGARLREASNTDAAVLQNIPYGDKVEAFGAEITGGAQWNHVIAGNGQQGWIFGALLSPTKPEPAPPPKPPTEPIPSGDKWKDTIDWVLTWEGGYQNIPEDNGNWTGCAQGKGENKGTNFGISACSYPSLDIKNISKQQAIDIYQRDFWVPSGASALPWPYCLLVMDTAVLHGKDTAKNWLAESGPNAYDFAAKRLHAYTKFGNWDTFGKAWTNRTADLLEEMGA